jgi:aryl-alcohol dehydrogenase-like predicted oxidoreductase
MEYRWLGSSGLKVSSLALGAMGFGGSTTGGWVGNHELDDVQRHVGMALDAGVILFDSANSYQKGTAEELLGKALGANRDRVLVSTKVNSRVGEGVNDVGQSRWHILRSCEDSLRRLGTDRIDIYHVHGFDACTPLEESLGALDALVQSGKVRYIACSNHAAWQIMKALSVADRRGLSRYVATQSYYTLVARELEWEIMPLSRDQGLGLLVWSPLAGGFLSGKFSRAAEPPPGTRRAMIGNLGVGPIDEEQGFAIVDVMRDIAEQRGGGVTCAQVALNWLRTRDLVSSIIIGARSDEQLADNLAATQWTMTADEQQRLDEVSAVPFPYPHWYQRQFTAERYSREGAPGEAFTYQFPTAD